MKSHNALSRIRQSRSRHAARFVSHIGVAVLAFVFSRNGFAREESKEDHERAVSEIVDLRLRTAFQSYWSDATGFSMAPMQLENAVKERDGARVKQLEEKYPTIWKSVSPVFAAAYVRRQQPINDKGLQKSDELRSLIRKAIEAGVHARGGGSASADLYAFAGAETEWILRQLWNGSAHPISDDLFEKQLRSSIFYLDGSPHSTDDAKEFSTSLESFRRALRLLTPEQQSVLQKEALAYFSD